MPRRGGRADAGIFRSPARRCPAATTFYVWSLDARSAGSGRSVSATCVSFAVTCERGYVTRHREGYDRRRVVVRPTDAALDGTERFLGFAGAEIAAAVRETPDAELRAIRAFLGRMTQAASAANVRLRDAPASARTEA